MKIGATLTQPCTFERRVSVTHSAMNHCPKETCFGDSFNEAVDQDRTMFQNQSNVDTEFFFLIAAVD